MKVSQKASLTLPFVFACPRRYRSHYIQGQLWNVGLNSVTLKPSNVVIVLLFTHAQLDNPAVGVFRSRHTLCACERGNLHRLRLHANAALSRCHVAMPKDREERYSRLRAGMEKFIRENAKNDAEKILSRIETVNIKGALQSLRSCQSADFKFARQTIDQITDGDHEALFKNSLALPRDPMQGDCIN